MAKWLYQTCNLETLDGITQAEKLLDLGWIVISSSPFSIMFEKKIETKKTYKT